MQSVHDPCSNLPTFSETPWYPAYAGGYGFWGVSTLEEQQVGGLIMWVSAGSLCLAVALALVCAEPRNASAADSAVLAKANPKRGKAMIRRYGCVSCHKIPGVRGAQSEVGPPLKGIASRTNIAGVLTNRPANMVRWIRNPPAVDSLTAMPFLGVTARDARDIASYLYTLK